VRDHRRPVPSETPLDSWLDLLRLRIDEASSAGSPAATLGFLVLLSHDLDAAIDRAALLTAQDSTQPRRAE
jgi:hypothetical protein